VTSFTHVIYKLGLIKRCRIGVIRMVVSVNVDKLDSCMAAIGQ